MRIITIAEKRLLFRKKKLIESREKLVDHQEVRDLLIFKSLPESKIKTYRSLWDQYYKDCKNTEVCMIYEEMSRLFKNPHPDKIRMKELLKRNKELREERDYLSEPNCLDPYEMENSPAHWYLERIEKINKEIFAIDEELEIYQTDVNSLTQYL
jgi:hypothetical protein